MSRLYVAAVLGNLAPTLLTRAQEALHREIRVDHFSVDQPGILRADGVHVARGARLHDGELLSVDHLEIRYDPALLAVRSLLSLGRGGNTTAEVRATGVRIPQLLPAYHGDFLAVRSVSTRVDLAPLLHGGDVAATVGRVDTAGVSLHLIRKPDLHWNYEPLIRMQRPGKPTRFRGEIRIADADVTLDDYHSGSLPAPARNRGVFRGALRFAAFPALEFDGDGRILGPNGGAFRLSGVSQTREHRWLATVDGQVASARYWFRYFSPPNQQVVDVLAGSGAVTVSLWDQPDGTGHRTSFAVDASITGGAARVRGIAAPIREFRGHVAINPAGLWLDGNGSAGGLTADTSGHALFGLDGRTWFRFTSRNVRLASLRRLFPALPVPQGLQIPEATAMDGVLRGEPQRWTFTGTLAAPHAQLNQLRLADVRSSFELAFLPGETAAARGAFRARAAAWNGTAAEAVSGDYRVRDRVAEIRSRFATLGGRVEARGWMDLSDSPFRFYLQGSAVGLDVSRLPLEAVSSHQVAGAASSEFVASGTMNEPRISAFVRASPLVVEGETLNEVSGRVRYHAGTYDIPYLSVRDPRAQATLSGSVTPGGALHLTAQAAGVDLAVLLAGRSKEPVRGRAWIQAEIQGTEAAPAIVGRIQVYQPGFRSYDADYAQAGFAAAGRNSVQVSDVNLITGLGAVRSPALTFRREATPGATWEVQGELEAEGLTIPRALRLAGVRSEQLREHPLAAGLDEVKLTLSGAASQPNITFRLVSAAAAVSGIDLGRVTASGRLDLAHSMVHLDQVTSRSAQQELDLHGTVRYEPGASSDRLADRAHADLDLTVRGARLKPWIERFAPSLFEYARVEGSLASFTGHVSGGVENPHATGRAQVEDVVVNGRAIEVAPVDVDWTPEAALLGPVHARVGSGTLDLPFVAVRLHEALKPGENVLDRLATSATLTDIPAAVLQQLLQDSPAYSGERLRPVREMIAQWKSGVGGRISASVQLPVDAAGSRPTSAASAAELLGRRASPALVTARISSTDLVSPPDGSAPPTLLAVSGWMRGGHVHIDEFRLQQDGGVLVTAAGDRQASQGKQGGAIQLTVKATGLRLASLARLPLSGLKERLDPFEPLDGALQVQGEVNGTDREPNARFSLTVDRLLVAGLSFDQFQITEGDYRAAVGQLRMVAAKLSRHLPDEEAAVLLSGALPLTWPELTSPRTAERSLTVEVPRQSLAVFGALAADSERLAKSGADESTVQMRPVVRVLRELAATEGRMEGRFTLGGTATRPRNDGYLALTDGKFHWDGMQTEIRELNARVDLSGNLVRVSRFSGKSSLSGGFEGGGEIRLGQDINGGAAARLDLTFAVNGFKFQEKKVASLLGAAFTGSQVQGVLTTVNPSTPGRSQPLTINGDWPSPTISGGIQLDDASLVLAYQETSGPPGRPFPADPRLNVRLIAGKNVWLRNPGVRLQLRDSVLASNTIQQAVISGTLQVPTGTLSVSGLRLRNAEGQIRINYDARAQELGGTARPPIYVDLSASTSLRVQRSAAVEAEYYDTTFQIRGYPGGGGDAAIRPDSVAGGLSAGTEGGLTLTVRTDPPLPSREIEALIRQQLGVEGFAVGGANSVEAVRSQLEQAFAVNLSAPLANEIENILQRTFRLSTVSLDVGITQPLRVRIGKRLFGPVFGTFSQEFGSVQNQWSFEVYLRVTPQLRVGYRQEEPFERKVFFFSGVKSF